MSQGPSFLVNRLRRSDLAHARPTPGSRAGVAPAQGEDHDLRGARAGDREAEAVVQRARTRVLRLERAARVSELTTRPSRPPPAPGQVREDDGQEPGGRRARSVDSRRGREPEGGDSADISSRGGRDARGEMTGRSQKCRRSLPMSQQHALVSKLTPTAVALRSAPRTRARTQPGSGGRDGRPRRALLRRALLLRSAGLVRGGSSEVGREPTAAARARPPPSRTPPVPTAATSR